MKSLSPLLASVLLVSAIGAPRAYAETVFFTDDGPGFVNHYYFAPTQLSTLTLPLFDSSQGTLNSVTLSITGALQAVIALGCIQTFDGCYIAEPNQPGDLTYFNRISVRSGLLSLNNILSPLNPVLTLSVTASVPQTPSFGNFQSAALLDVQVIDLDLAPSLFAVNGGGMFDLTCSGAGTMSNNGLFRVVSNPNLSATACGASIVYNYAPVPEPASIALLSLGLIALSVIGRRVTRQPLLKITEPTDPLKARA